MNCLHTIHQFNGPWSCTNGATLMGSFQANKQTSKQANKQTSKQASKHTQHTRAQCSPTNVGLTQVCPNKLASSAVKSTMLSLHVLWIASSIKELSGTHISRAACSWLNGPQTSWESKYVIKLANSHMTTSKNEKQVAVDISRVVWLCVAQKIYSAISA